MLRSDTQPISHPATRGRHPTIEYPSTPINPSHNDSSQTSFAISSIGRAKDADDVLHKLLNLFN